MGFWDKLGEGVLDGLEGLAQGLKHFQVDDELKSTQYELERMGFELVDVQHDGFAILMERKVEKGFLSSFFSGEEFEYQRAVVYADTDLDIQWAKAEEYDVNNQAIIQRCPECDELLANEGVGIYICSECDTVFQRDKDGRREELDDDELEEFMREQGEEEVVDFEAPGATSDDAFAFFSVDPDCTDAKKILKNRYREMMKQYHPDKVESMNLADGFKEFATEQTRKIQEMYDICQKWLQKNSSKQQKNNSDQRVACANTQCSNMPFKHIADNQNGLCGFCFDNGVQVKKKKKSKSKSMTECSRCGAPTDRKWAKDISGGLCGNCYSL